MSFNEIFKNNSFIKDSNIVGEIYSFILDILRYLFVTLFRSECDAQHIEDRFRSCFYRPFVFDERTAHPVNTIMIDELSGRNIAVI